MRKLKEEPLSTVEDLMAVPDDIKAELISGVIHAMAPASARHSLIAGLLIAKIITHTQHKKEKGPRDPDAWIILPGAWVDYDEHNSFVHDIAGFSRKDLPKLPESGAIQVKPVWVCEVISPSN